MTGQRLNSELYFSMFRFRKRCSWPGVVMHCFRPRSRRGKFMDYASDELDVLQEIVDSNILIWSMRIRSGVAGSKRHYRYRGLCYTAHCADWPTRRIHRIDERWFAINFSRSLDHCAGNARLCRRLREGRTSQLDDLDI